jgi:hypothetical protein
VLCQSSQLPDPISSPGIAQQVAGISVAVFATRRDTPGGSSNNSPPCTALAIDRQTGQGLKLVWIVRRMSSAGMPTRTQEPPSVVRSARADAQEAARKLSGRWTWRTCNNTQPAAWIMESAVATYRSGARADRKHSIVWRSTHSHRSRKQHRRAPDFQTGRGRGRRYRSSPDVSRSPHDPAR